MCLTSAIGVRGRMPNRSHMKPSYRLTLVALLLAQPVFANNLPVYQGKDVVVTAARTPEYLRNVLSDVTIISRQQIETAGQQTLTQLLQAQGGVEISSTGGRGQPSSVFIRGANSNQTLVLVNGLRVNSATLGATALENIPLDQIDHIEILRGPASSLYGADAIGGVIQIFTRRGIGHPRPYFSVSAGSYGTRAVNGGFLGESGKWRFSVDVGHLASDGFSATNANAPAYVYNPDDDSYRNTNVGTQLSYAFDRDNTLGVSGWRSEGVTHFDSGPTTDDVNDHLLSAYAIHSRNRLTRNWESSLRLGESTDDYQTVGAYPGRYRTDQTQLTWQNNITTDVGLVTLGLERLAQHVTSSTRYTQTNRTIRSGFMGYIGRFGAHQLQVNVRRDDNGQFGTHNTGSLAYGYHITAALRAIASISTAFKVPTFNDLYYPTSPYWGGNPDLSPEQSHNRQVGLSYQAQSRRAKVVYFDNHINNLIVADTAAKKMMNINSARIQGLALSYRDTFGTYQVGVSATLQEPQDEATGKRLQRRADKFATVSVQKTLDAWRVGGELVASGGRYDSRTEAPGTRMGGYGLVNLTATYRLKRDWSLSARWGNVLDKRYVLAKGYNTPGSNVFFTLRYAPK